MGTFLKIAGIVLGVCAFGFVFMLIPDYWAPEKVLSEGFWAMGDINRFLIAVFGILPAIIMIILCFGRDERWHFEEWSYRLGRIACCAVIVVATFLIEMNGPLSNALSFFLNVYVIIYFVYSIVFHGPFKKKFSFDDWALPVLEGGALVIIVALSYILAPSGVWLPQNITIPISIGGIYLPISAYFGVALVIYELIAQLVSLPDQRSHSRGSQNKQKYSDFETISTGDMEFYVKSACKRLGISLARIDGKAIYLNGFVSDKEFWKTMLDVSGRTHSNVDGWWIRCQ